MRVSILMAMILAACAPSAAVPLESPTPQPQQDTFPASASFRYVAVGASDSVGVGASDPARKSWPALLAARMPARTAYLNLGVSGSTVAQALVEQLPDAVSHQADVLTVWLAFNDLASGVDPSAYRADLSRLLDALLRENRGLIFVANLPDLRRVAAPSGVDRNAVATVVERYNATIADVVRSRAPRTILVDLFTGSEEVIATQLVVSADGLHPNDLGYARIAERFAEVMRRAGVPLR